MSDQWTRRVRFTWTYETQVPFSYIDQPEQMDTIAMEAFTQGDGELNFQTLEGQP